MRDPELEAGSVLAGRFRVERLLGVGGMGAVYLVRHEVLQRQVALKLLHRELLSDLGMMARFQLEARAASRIEHPCVTRVHDFGHSEDGIPYLVMEYAPGPTLAAALDEDGALSVHRALELLAQIAEGLAAAHAVDVLHRDLKPGNIVVQAGDRVKILDFGLAKIVGADAPPSLSTQGFLFGTPEYMSPEQVAGAKLDARTDLYSLGVLAFLLLTGREPFEGAALDVMTAHVKSPPPIPSVVSGRAELTPALDRLVLGCLEKNPADRIASATEVAEELRRQVTEREGGPAAPGA
jgi:eukaryotic-like serine/threonine-protein kinase